MPRDTDSLGNQRPSYARGSVQPRLALPDTIRLTPIRLPRPRIDGRNWDLRDTYEHRNPYSTRQRRSSFDYNYRSGSVAHIADLVNRGPTRRLSSIEIPQLTNVNIRSSRGVSTYPTVTDQIPLATYPRRSRPSEVPRSSGIDYYERRSSRPFVEERQERPLRAGSPTPLVRPTINTEALQERTAARNVDPKEVQANALQRNPMLSYQRFFFTLLKYPALILILISLWTLFGRGFRMTLFNTEQGANIAALSTGGFVICSTVLLLHQHYNCYKKAKIMSYLYHLVHVGALCGAIISLVFCSVTFHKLQKFPFNDQDKCRMSSVQPDNSYCLSYRDRINYLSIILGANAMLICFSFISLVFGAIGQSLLKRRLSEEYARISKNNASYINQALQY